MGSAKFIAWAAAITAIVAIAFEATVRIDDWAQFDVPISSPYKSLDELIVRDTQGMHARPSSEFRQFRVNSLGFRGPEVETAKLARGKVVIVSGASESFGLYETSGKEWPRQLEDSLALRCGKDVVVLNAAFAGMSLPTVAQDLDLRLKSIGPKILIYYPTPMQYLEADLPVAARIDSTPVRVPSMWRPRGASRLRDAVKRSVPDAILDQLRVWETKSSRSKLGTAPLATAPSDRLDAYDAGLRSIIGRARGHGIEPVLVVHRNRFRDTTELKDRQMLRAWERFYPRFTGGAILAFDDSAANRTLSTGRDSNVVVVDPLPTLTPLGARAFADFSHFTDIGAAAVGGAAAAKVAGPLCGTTR